MVPDVDTDSPLYIDAQSDRDRGRYTNPLIDGVEMPHVRAIYLGEPSWAWVYQTDENGHRHICPGVRPGHDEVCSTVVYGAIEPRLRERTPA